MISKRISLYFRTGISSEYVHSNKLARAILKNCIELYGESMLEKLISSPFATSDLFPFLYSKNKKKREYLLPKPLMPLISDENGEIPNFKSLKKAKYITEEALNSFYTDGKIQFSTLDEKNGIIKLKDQELELSMFTDSRPRNSLLRSNQPRKNEEDEVSSNQFFFTELFNIKQGGFYFIVVTETEEMMNIILNSIKLLEHKGLGGDISTGFGSFKILEIENYVFNEEETDERMVLSHWIPGEKDKENKIVVKSYDLEEYSPISITSKNIPSPLKNTILFKSGSVLKNVSTRIIGSHKEIGTKEDPSYSWGYAITKGLKKNV